MSPLRSFSGFLLMGFACGTRNVRQKQETQMEVSGFGSAAQALWDDYVKAADLEAEEVTPGLQPLCEPMKYNNKGSYKGTIIMFHGYTACPQQFERLVPILTARGYVVLTPTLPGFGYQWKEVGGEIEDYIDDMPTDKRDYREYGDRMVAIMNAVSSGEKMVFGHSLGGAVASYVNYHGDFDRALIAAPMVRTAGVLDTILSALNLGGLVGRFAKARRAGWGEPCEIERSQGRAGVCQFTAAHGIAARDFGLNHKREVTVQAEPGTVQVIFVENDQAVSAAAVRSLAQSYGIEKTSPYVCGMDAALGHSFLSPYDSPNENKYWLDEVNSKVADFLTAGVRFTQSGTIDGYPRCDLKSTP